jgi:uncharacterized membrane protein
MGRKFWALFGLFLTLLGLYNFAKDGSWASIVPGILCLSMAAYMKDSEF